jgi:hypothetical protein
MYKVSINPIIQSRTRLESHPTCDNINIASPVPTDKREPTCGASKCPAFETSLGDWRRLSAEECAENQNRLAKPKIRKSGYACTHSKFSICSHCFSPPTLVRSNKPEELEFNAKY